MSTLWDMHVHLDFVADPQAVAREADELGLGLFACTVAPDGYERMLRLLGDAPGIRLAAGLHPWWIADGRCGEPDVASVAKAVHNTRFVGEIGLDASPKHVPDGSMDAQVRALEAICTACAETSETAAPKVLSLHSVRAAGLTLDILERTGALSSCNCIFHWFSGTSDELHRAVKAGCWFSVNEMMLRTRRGREYARQLPADKLLLETDLPPGEGVPFAAAQIKASLGRTLEGLRTIRGADMCAITCANSQILLS